MELVIRTNKYLAKNESKKGVKALREDRTGGAAKRFGQSADNG